MEIQHHGIKGQKWGVRRFQNEDGSLTAAGRKRYNVDIEGAKERVNSAKKRFNEVRKSIDFDKIAKASEELAFEKYRLSSERIKEKLNRENGKKSKHRIQLEKRYLEKGMSPEEAEIAAYKRARTEKIIAAVAGTTIAAAAAYVAYKHYDNNADKIIKSGATLQNINTHGNQGVQDAFYFSMNKSDNKKYAGLYAAQLGLGGADVYKTRIGVKQSLKIASPRTAQKTLAEIISKDPNNSKMLQERLNYFRGGFPLRSQKSLISKALSDLRGGKVTKSVYDAANLCFIERDEVKNTDAFRKNFYDALTNKGYNGIIDVNDKKYSGYKAKSPMIAFNTGKKLALDSVTKMGDEEIGGCKTIEYIKLGAKHLTKTILPMAAGATVFSLVTDTVIDAKKRDEIVSDYKRDHPGTKLSYNEILENYYSK